MPFAPLLAEILSLPIGAAAFRNLLNFRGY